MLVKHEDLMRVLKHVNEKLDKRNNGVLKEWSICLIFLKILVQSQQGSPGTF